MPHHGQLATDEEINAGSWAGLYGAANGAARWGIASALLGTVLYFTNPIYRNLTFQFKVYLQMSGMTIGSMIEADRRVREHEQQSRRMRKLKRDQLVWKAYEEDYSRVTGTSRTAGAGAKISNGSTEPDVGNIKQAPAAEEKRTEVKNTASEISNKR